MRAMILCAGLSTRLGPLGDVLPKPLLPVCNVPILRYGVALLTGHGITDIVINLHHKGELIQEALGDGSALGARIQYLTEPDILGTGGGLKNALPLLDPDGDDQPFLSMNGKLIFDLDIAALSDACARDPDVLGTMVVRPVPDATDWGAVDVEPDAQGRLRVRNILGPGKHMFCGVHVTRPSVVARLPDGEACMVRQGYLPWLREGGQVAAFEVDPARTFAEHSTPARYLDSNRALLHGAHLSHPPAGVRLRGIDDSAHVHPTATINHPVCVGADAHIGAEAVVGPDAVVGEHAIVEAGSHIERAVVWSHTRATGRVVDAVVTWQGSVSVTPESPQG